MRKGTDVVIGDALKSCVQEKTQVGVVRMRVGYRRDELPDVARPVRRIERHQLDIGLAKPPPVRGRLPASAGLAGTALVMLSARTPTGERGASASSKGPGIGAEISGHDGIQSDAGLQADGVRRSPGGYRSGESESLSGVLGRSARGGAQGSGLQVETTHGESGSVRASLVPRTGTRVGTRDAGEIEDFAAPADRQLDRRAGGERATRWRVPRPRRRAEDPGQPSDLPSEAISTISG